MEDRGAVFADEGEHCVIGLHVEAGSVLVEDIGREAGRASQLARHADAAHHRRLIFLGREIVEEHRGRGARVGRAQAHFAATGRPQLADGHREAREVVRRAGRHVRADGAEVELDIRALHAVDGAREQSAELDAGGHGPRLQQQPLQADAGAAPHGAQSVVGGDWLAALVHEARLQMVLQVAPDLGQVVEHLDAVARKLLAVADAREHQDLRRLQSARAQHHFARGACLHQFVADPIPHAHGAPALENDPLGVRIRHDLEILPGDSGSQVRLRSRAAQPRARRQLEVAHAPLALAVEVAVAGHADRVGGGDEGFHEFMAALDVRDAHRPVATVELAGAAIVPFRAAEVRQDVLVAPAFATECAPAVEILVLAADVDEPVDRARAAERAPARRIDLPVVQVRLRLGLELPVEHRVVHGLAVADRDVDPDAAVGGP